MADAKLLNLQKVLEKLKRIPDSVQAAVAAQLKIEVNDLVDAMKRAAPVDDGSKYAGALRDSVHAYENPDRPLSYRIIADARDDDGHLIGSHVEQGHRTSDGKHVPGQPFFYPSYRARKKSMRRRISAAARKAIKDL